MESLSEKKRDSYTFKYFPKEKFMIVSDSAVQLYGLKKHYASMPEDFLAEICEYFRDEIRLIFRKLDLGVQSDAAVIKIKDSNIIYKITFIISEYGSDKMPKSVLGFMEDISDRVSREHFAGEVVAESNREFVSQALKQNSIIHGLGEIYFITYYIDLVKLTYVCLSAKSGVRKDLVSSPDLVDAFNEFLEKIVSDGDREAMREFCNLDTIAERTGNLKSLEKEYYSNFKGYCRATFIITETDSDGKPSKALFLCKDITEEKSFLESQHTLIRALSSTYQNIYTINFENGTSKVYRLSDVISEKYGSFFQFGEYEECLGVYVEREVIEDDKRLFDPILTLSAVKKILQEKQQYSFSYRVHRGGKIGYFRCQLVQAAEGSAEFVIAFKNIDDEVDLEIERQQEFNEHIAIIRALSENYKSIYCLDTEKGTASAYRLNYQYQEDFKQFINSEIVWNELFKSYVDKFVVEPYREELFERYCTENILHTIGERSWAEYEYQNYKAGVFRYYKIKATKLAEIAGKEKIVIGFSDVSDQREQNMKIQFALRDAFRAADAANRAKSDFLANMSHDIRTPMNAIMGMTAIAQSHLDEKERVADCLTKINTASQHLLSLINEILDMSKIESGKMDLLEEKINLSDLTENLLLLVRPQIQEHSHDLTVEIRNLTHENVLGDSLRIQQIFTNIMSNAIKYTADGGKIRLEISEKPSGKENIACYEFVFEDNGFGIPADYLKTLFDPFVRSTNENISHIQGTGLGMPIARNIARMMGGDISVESTVGKGSKFTATIFLKTQENEDLSRFNGIKILSLSTEPERMQSVCSVLDSIGLNRVCSKSALEAMAHLDEGGYRAVVIDFDLQGDDVLALTKKIRAKIGKSVPILAVTASDWADFEQSARSSGVSEFLSRPLFKSRLVKMLDAVFQSAEPGSVAPLASVANLDFSGYRALLVEDNDLNAEIASEILSMTALCVERASDGTEAVEMVKRNADGYYNIIFMDIQMPKMNGYDSSRAIRNLGLPYCESVPIVAMTANAFADDVHSAFEAGMNEHISKPIDFNALSKVLSKWILKDESRA